MQELAVLMLVMVPLMLLLTLSTGYLHHIGMAVMELLLPLILLFMKMDLQGVLVELEQLPY
jgi:hypothetical protein